MTADASVASSADQGDAQPAGSPSGGWQHPRAPLDNRFVLGLALRQRRHLLLAGTALLLCVASNLASPLLMGALFETLVEGRPFERCARAHARFLPGASRHRLSSPRLGCRS